MAGWHPGMVDGKRVSAENEPVGDPARFARGAATGPGPDPPTHASEQPCGTAHALTRMLTRPHAATRVHTSQRDRTPRTFRTSHTGLIRSSSGRHNGHDAHGNTRPAGTPAAAPREPDLPPIMTVFTVTHSNARIQDLRCLQLQLPQKQLRAFWAESRSKT